MMEKFNLKFTNPDQILNMGGPWIGDLIINGVIISTDIILDNVFVCNKSDQIFFVKYRRKKFFFSKYYFTVCSFNLKSREMTEYRIKFDMLYIKEVINDELHYFDAFHGEDSSLLRSIQLK